MQKIILIGISLILSLHFYAQEINIGVSGHLGMWKQYTTLNASFNKSKWVIRPTIKYGNFGKNDSIFSGGIEVSGYSTEVQQALDKPFSPQFVYNTFWSSTTNRGISPELKVGRIFSKEENKSSFSVYISFAYYWINDTFNTYYVGKRINNMNEVVTDNVTASTQVKHQNFSLGLSLGYAYEISKKINIEAMINIPYYQPITSSTYNPNEFGTLNTNPTPLMLNNFNLDVSIGINYQLK